MSSAQWYRFLNPAEDESDQQLNIRIKKLHFPYMFREDTIQITTLDIIMQLKDPTLYSSTSILNLYLAGPVSEETPVPLNPAIEEPLNSQPIYRGLGVPFTIENEDVELVLTAREADISLIPEELWVEEGGHIRLKSEEIEDIFIIAHYYTES